MTDRPDPVCEALLKLHDSMPLEFRRLSSKYGDTTGVFQMYSMGFGVDFVDQFMAAIFQGKT